MLDACKWQASRLLIIILLTNKCTICKVNTFLFLITLLHVSIHKHYHDEVSLFTKLLSLLTLNGRDVPVLYKDSVRTAQ